MNRAQRRAAAAREKMQRNAERVRRIVEEANAVADMADKFRTLIFALARRDGRLRVRREDIDALGENDRIDFIRQENGDVIVQYTAGG